MGWSHSLAIRCVSAILTGADVAEQGGKPAGTGQRDREDGMLKTRAISFAVVGAIAVLLSACAGGLPSLKDVAPEVRKFHAPEEMVHLKNGQKLKIIGFGKASISGDYVIGADGTIDLGRYGKVVAAGLSVPQLEERIAAHLARRGHADMRISVLPDSEA